MTIYLKKKKEVKSKVTEWRWEVNGGIEKTRMAGCS